MVGLCSDSGQPNKAFRGYCPFCWSTGTGVGGRVGCLFHTHTHTHRVGVKCYCTSDLSGPLLQLLGVE